MSTDNPPFAQTLHDTRNQLNRITMQTELAKMLLEQNAPAEKIFESLDKVLAACDACSENLSTLKQSI